MADCGGQTLRCLLMIATSWFMPLCNSLPLSVGRTCDFFLTNRIWQWSDSVLIFESLCLASRGVGETPLHWSGKSKLP